VGSLPAKAGRDGNAIVAALAKGDLGGLVVGGVDPDDTADPAATRAAIEAASFVVALELRETEVTRAADVVFPVAPVTDKGGMFVTWEGRPRPFDQALSNPGSLPDLRILAGIAEDLARLGQGSPLGFRTVADARAQMEEMGPWDGPRAQMSPSPAVERLETTDGMTLATWKQMLDNGSMQDGDKYLAATARPVVVRVSATVYNAVGPVVTVTGDRGSVTLPAEIADDIVDGVVWLPTNSTGNGVLADVASPGSRVRVTGGAA
jgi:NADH-quinone oxidoreductase subunit G